MLYEYESSNLRGRREFTKKIKRLSVIEERTSIIAAKKEDHARFLIQEYLFSRTDANSNQHN